MRGASEIRVADPPDVKQLRKEAGAWLKRLREDRQLSQRQLAELVQVEYYTFISQIEAGRGRVPAERLEIWANALGVDPRTFAKTLMRYYDPISYRLVFPDSDEAIEVRSADQS